MGSCWKIRSSRKGVTSQNKSSLCFSEGRSHIPPHSLELIKMGAGLVSVTFKLGRGCESEEQGLRMGASREREVEGTRPAYPGSAGRGQSRTGKEPRAQRSSTQLRNQRECWGSCLHTAPGSPQLLGGAVCCTAEPEAGRTGAHVHGAVRRRRQERTLPLTLYIKNIHSSCAQNSIIHIQVPPASLLGPGTA